MYNMYISVCVECVNISMCVGIYSYVCVCECVSDSPVQ